MHRLAFLGTAVLVIACSSGKPSSQPAPDQAVTAQTVPFMNGRLVDGMLVGGQPTAAELETAATVGVKTIINLRPSGEGDFDSGPTSKRLGLAYVSIPVAGAAGVTVEAARQLDAALSEAEGPVLLHCGSGNRAGALLAIRAHVAHKKSVEESIEIGKAAGLTSLESVVRDRLSEVEQ